MRKNIVGLSLLLAFSSAIGQTEKAFEIKGSLKNIALPVQKVFINYQSNGNNIMDSVEVKDNQYVFTGKVTEPLPARMRIKYAPAADGKPVKIISGRDMITLFISSDNIKVVSTDSFSNATIKGSKANDEFKKLTALLKPVNDQLNTAYEAYSKASAAKDEASRKALEDKIDALSLDSKKVYGDYAKENPNSLIALYAVNQYAGWDINAEEVGPLFAALPVTTQQTASGKNLNERLEIARKTAIGNYAMEFTQNDTLGTPVSLSSFKGKYLLVDFWASWCGPCRRENPNVVKAFQEFKNKNFHILSVSLDQPGAKDKWIDAIHKDNLTWSHVSDLKYWENDVAKQYGIRAIPQNFLLDPTGKIVAKNLNGEELHKKLTSLITE
jgi:peroxiredoxin